MKWKQQQSNGTTVVLTFTQCCYVTDHHAGRRSDEAADNLDTWKRRLLPHCRERPFCVGAGWRRRAALGVTRPAWRRIVWAAQGRHAGRLRLGVRYPVVHAPDVRTEHQGERQPQRPRVHTEQCLSVNIISRIPTQVPAELICIKSGLTDTCRRRKQLCRIFGLRCWDFQWEGAKFALSRRINTTAAAAATFKIAYVAAVRTQTAILFI